MRDGERPAVDPKAVVLWVGTNNVKNPNAKNADPAAKLDWCGRAPPLGPVLLPLRGWGWG